MRTALVLSGMILLATVALAPTSVASHGASTCSPLPDGCEIACHPGQSLRVELRVPPGASNTVAVSCGGISLQCWGFHEDCVAQSSETVSYADTGFCYTYDRQNVEEAVCEAIAWTTVAGMDPVS